MDVDWGMSGVGKCGKFRVGIEKNRQGEVKEECKEEVKAYTC